MNLLLLGLACLLPQEAQQPEPPKQEMAVQVREAVFYKQPSRLRGIVRKAEYKELVTLVETKGRFSKVTLKEGTEAWILSVSLIPKEKFKPAASNEKELMALKAEGYEAGRFNQETEEEYRREKGPAMNKAYMDLDALEQRRPDSVTREERLRKFREAGKLGEFASQ